MILEDYLEHIHKVLTSDTKECEIFIKHSVDVAFKERQATRAKLNKKIISEIERWLEYTPRYENRTIEGHEVFRRV